MAVSLVGTGTFVKSTINGTSTALTISTGAAASGDLCIAYWVHTRGALTAQLVSSAGTAYTELGSFTNGNLGVEFGYRVLTSSETTVASCNTGSAQDSVVLAAVVLRGVSSSPLIIQEASTTAATSNPNSPLKAIPWPNSAVVTACGILSNTTLTAPSGFGSAVSTGATDTRSCAGALAYLSTNPPSIDPSSWTGGAAAAWIATTITVASTESPSLPMGSMTVWPSYIDSKQGMIGY